MYLLHTSFLVSNLVGVTLMIVHVSLCLDIQGDEHARYYGIKHIAGVISFSAFVNMPAQGWHPVLLLIWSLT